MPNIFEKNFLPREKFRRLSPWDSQLRPTFYPLRVYGNNGQIAPQEFDTTFAEKVYKKLLQKHH